MKGTEMSRNLLLLTILLGSALIDVSRAGTYNKQLNIGDLAPSWNDLVGADGKKHSLGDLADKEVVVVCFTCNTCPYAVDYEDRLIELAKRFAAEGNRCALIAINANKVKDDLLPAMQERANAKRFNFAYLHDETQQVARSYGAAYTPEFVVLNKERKVVYLGAWMIVRMARTLPGGGSKMPFPLHWPVSCQRPPKRRPSVVRFVTSRSAKRID